LLIREPRTVCQGICDHSAGLLRRTLTAERSTHADEQDRQKCTTERTPSRQATGKARDGLTDINAVGARQPVQNDLTRSGQNPGPQQDQDVPPSIGVRRGIKQIGTRPCPTLHELQQACESRAGDPGACAGQQHRQPEAQGSCMCEHRRYRSRILTLSL